MFVSVSFGGRSENVLSHQGSGAIIDLVIMVLIIDRITR